MVPAQYRVTVVKTLMMSPDGGVYEKEYPNTLEAFTAMTRFNPDRSPNEIVAQ